MIKHLTITDMMNFNFNRKPTSATSADTLILRADRYLMKKVGLTWDDLGDTVNLFTPNGDPLYDERTIIDACEFKLINAGFYR